MSIPLVSVIIPVRNYERFVGAAIESVLNQTLTDREVIIVDDCSNDRTPEILAAYTDGERVRSVRNPTNIGQFPTHNRGAELARGKYLKFFHGDDVMHPHCLEMMVTLMEAFPSAGVGISHHPWPWVAPHLFAPPDAWRAELGGQTSLLCQGPSASIFRADVFRKVGCYRNRHPYEDTVMNCLIAMAHPVLLLPAGLFWWRLHGQQVSTASISEAGRIQREVQEFLCTLALLSDSGNPLPPAESATAKRRCLTGFTRLVLFYLRRGQLYHARELMRQSGMSLGSLRHAFGSTGKRNLVPVTNSINWTVFPGLGYPSVRAAIDAQPESPPMVSVLVPMRNAAQTIVAAIESVLAQRFHDWELVIVDDASSDECAAIAGGYDDGKRIRVVRSDLRAGKWATHNRCAELAKGRYLKFLHADDLLYPHCLETMVSLAEAHPAAPLIQSHEPGSYLTPKLLTPAEVYQQEMFGSARLWETPTRTLYRRDAWEVQGGYDPRWPAAHAHLHLELCRSTPALIVHGGLVYCRRSSGKQQDHTRCDRNYSAADLVWLRELLQHPACPLDDPDRQSALVNLGVLRRNVALLPLWRGESRVARSLRRHLALPHRHDDLYWHRYGGTLSHR